MAFLGGHTHGLSCILMGFSCSQLVVPILSFLFPIGCYQATFFVKPKFSMVEDSGFVGNFQDCNYPVYICPSSEVRILISILWGAKVVSLMLGPCSNFCKK